MYLIHPTQRAVILADLPNAGQVLATIHTAREIELRSKRVIVCPFGVWEAQVLRSLGVNVPSPIAYYYDWPRDRNKIPDPFQNQIETAAFATLTHRGFILNEIGTGKTLSALWAADYLMRVGMIRKVLILSPLSTLERVWGDAVFEHLPGRSIAVLHGTAAKRKKLFVNDAFDFYVINHDAIDIIADIQKKVMYADQPDHVKTAVLACPPEKRAAVFKDLTGYDPPAGGDWFKRTAPIGQKVTKAELLRNDIDLFIIDECAVYRNHRNERFKMLKTILTTQCSRAWVWGMTGTPIPNEPSDAWAQCHLIVPQQVSWSFTSFKQTVMQKLSDHIWLPLEDAHKRVYEVMQPAIRFERDQCYDLPPCTYTTHEVALTAEQKKHYKEVATKLFTEIQGGAVSAVNEGVKAGKLVQVACGVVYDNEGAERTIDVKPRIELVKELIEQTEHKVIVFVPFTGPLKMLFRELEKHFKCALVYGGTSAGERNRIFAEFQQCHEPRVLVADAGTMSHGLTLTEASTIIWYGPEWSNDVYTQANGRITRAGQKNAQHIIHIAGTEIEKRIYRRLQQRGSLQGALLELVANGGQEALAA